MLGVWMASEKARGLLGEADALVAAKDARIAALVAEVERGREIARAAARNAGEAEARAESVLDRFHALCGQIQMGE